MAKPLNPKIRLDTVKTLYYKKNMSMGDISKRLNVSIDVVYYFMRKHGLERRSFSEANKAVFNKKEPSFKIKKSLSKKANEIRVAGAMLYFAEGYKTEKSSGIDFANSDPDMINIFINFLRSNYVLDESRFRILLYCYSNQNIKNLIKFWSKLTCISKGQFSKPYVRNDFRTAGRTMKYGMVHLRYSDKKLLIDLKRIIREYIKEFNAPVV